METNGGDASPAPPFDTYPQEAHHPTAPPRSLVIAQLDLVSRLAYPDYAGSGISGLASGLLFPFGGSTAAFPLRWHGAEYESFGVPSYADARTVEERAIAIIDALGAGELEQGVFDTPEPQVHRVLPGPIDEQTAIFTIPIEADQPEFLPGWPEEWKKKPGDEPGWIPSDWVIPEEEEVAHDLGHLARQVVGSLFDVNGGASPMGYAPMGSPVPASWPVAAGGETVTVNTKTGKVTKCRRKRRRRLLTPTDLNDLAALKTIVGGGQAMNFAVMKAVRR